MKKVYALHGGDSKAGVTMIAHSMAQSLAADYQGKDILLISLSPSQSNQYFREEINTIDYYKNKIDSGLIVEKEVLRHSRLEDNLYVIDGLKEELQQRLYFPGNVKSFVDNQREQFDLILIDTGSQVDNGLAVGGLLASDMRFLVLPQSEVALERYVKRKEIYDRGEIEFDYCIINRYDEKDVLGLEYIKRRLKLKEPEILVLKEVKDSRRAEYEHKTFYDLKENVFMADIQKLADIIGEEAGFKKREQGKRKRWKSFI